MFTVDRSGVHYDLLGEATIGGEETRLKGNYPVGNSGPIMDG